jgi:hypothetical protein
VEEELVKVWRAVQVLALPRLRERVPLAPPTSAPKVPEYESEPLVVMEVVATFAKVFAPEKYGMLPTTAADEVERPLKVKAPVEELYASGNVAESEEDETLPAKVVQSADERSPLFAAEALGRLKVMVEPLPVMVKSVPLVEEAKIAVPLVV